MSLSVIKPDAYFTRLTGSLGWNKAEKSITFAGATPQAIGDFDGALATADVFTVTGTVIVRILAVCTTNIVHDGNATIELGIAADKDIIIATTDLTANEMAVQEIWHDAVPDVEIEAIGVLKEFIVTDGNDIVITCGIANTNTGVIRFTCFWTPVDSTGNVVAA